MDPEPPQYPRSSTSTSRRNSRPASGAVLSGSRHTSASILRPPSEHLYHLTNSKGRPWLTLKVKSNAPASNYLPVFFEGEAISGSITLHRKKEDSIKSVTVQVIGQMTSSATEVLNFLQVSQTLWSASASESSSSLHSHLSALVGDHSWPFSLTLPKKCDIKSPTGTAQSYALPGSFSERMARVHIQYQVLTTVHRSRFRVDSTLGTIIGYCPVIRPEAPSMARQVAYLENMPLPGPDVDPDGWKLLDSLQIRGSVFSTRTVDATCTLALATPLCYTRGSVIPCLMDIETTDPQALDLLSAPRSPVVRLIRSIATGESTLNPSSGKNLPTLEYEHVVQDVSTAVWRADTSRAPQKRVLHGEIHLPIALKPTCCLGRFELTYSVAVYSPNAVAFQPDGGGSTVLQQETVVIGTVYPSGPRPRAYSPPEYDDGNSVGQSSEFRMFR